MTTSHFSIRQKISRLWDPAAIHAHVEASNGQSGLRGFALRQWEIVVFTARNMRGGEISRRAAALTYHTLLAIVPMLAVGFALFQAFGGLRKLEAPLRRLIVENLAVGRAEVVGQWLEQFVANISAGAIAGVGLLLLFYSATSLLTTSESAFNRIWGVHRERPLHLRFAIYWCMVTVGPALLGLSISVTARLQSSAFATAVLNWLPFGLGRLLLSLASMLAVCVVFVLAYQIVPNTKVRFRCALTGGVVAGLLWSLVKAVFFWVSAGSVKYSAVYGALGALPLLMIWLYLSWLIVLFGVTYTYALQTVLSGRLHDEPSYTSQSFRETLAVWLMVEMARSFHAGQPPPSVDQMAQQVGASEGTIRHMLNLLTKHQLAIETSGGVEPGYVPARDISTLRLDQIINALRSAEGSSYPLNETATRQRLQAVLDKAAQASREVLETTALASLASPDQEESSK